MRPYDSSLSRTATVLAVGVVFCLLPGAAGAQQQAKAAAPVGKQEDSADDLLRRIDKQNTAFQDAIFHFKMQIKEPSGQVREIEFTNTQKGSQKRLVRFLSPGDIKGMGFLVESADVMYALLPAFGNRVRRVATHQKQASFMGSDLGYEDMSAIELAPTYAAKVAGPAEGNETVLELTARPKAQVEFPRLKVWVDPKNALLSKIEYYDASGKKARSQLRQDMQVYPGTNQMSPHKLVFIDHRRNNHETDLILLDSKFNTGIPDEQFTQRALQRE